METRSDIGLIASTYQSAKTYLRADYERTRERHPDVAEKLDCIESALSSIKVNAKQVYTTGVANTKDAYHNHRKRILTTNLNLLGTGVPSFLLAGATSQVLEWAGASTSTTAYVAAAVEFVAFNAFAITTHYKLNKEHYIDKETGKVHKATFWKDIGELYKPAIFTTAFFYAVAPAAQKWLMEEKHIVAGAANQIAYWSTALVCQVLYTAIGMPAGTFKPPVVPGNEETNIQALTAKSTEPNL